MRRGSSRWDHLLIQRGLAALQAAKALRVRISAIVDAQISLIVDAVSA